LTTYTRGNLIRFMLTLFTIVWAVQIYGTVGNHPRLALLYVPLLILSTFRFTVLVILFVISIIGIDITAPHVPVAQLGLAAQTALILYWAARGQMLRTPAVAGRMAALHQWSLRTTRPILIGISAVLASLTAFRGAPWLECLLWSLCCAVTAWAIPVSWQFRLRNVIATATLTAFSTLIAFAAVELGARIILPPAQGPSDMYMPDPEYIFTLRPNSSGEFHVRDNEGEGFSVEAVISSQGVLDRVLGPKADDEFRIVMLGDSYTMGHGLTPEQNIPHTVELLLNAANPPKRVTVINCGVGGYAPWQERGFLKARGFSFEPDLVILQVFPANDVAGTLTRVSKYLEVPDVQWESRVNEFRMQNEIPVAVQRWLRAHCRVYGALSDALRTPNLARDLVNDLRVLSPAHYPQPVKRADRNPYREASLIEWYPELEEAYRLLEQDIQGIRDDCRARGVALLAYCHPFPLATIEDGWEEFDEKTKGVLFEPHKDVRVTQEIFARVNIPFVNVTDALESQPGQSALYFRYDGHFTPKGADVVAQALADYLQHYLFSTERGFPTRDS